MEARVGFEPTNGGFADLSLGPLGYRAEHKSIANHRRWGAPVSTPRGRADSSYFLSGSGANFASRKNLADSSGGVGLI
jgi:hypothetical protein